METLSSFVWPNAVSFRHPAGLGCGVKWHLIPSLPWGSLSWERQKVSRDHTVWHYKRREPVWENGWGSSGREEKSAFLSPSAIFSSLSLGTFWDFPMEACYGRLGVRALVFERPGMSVEPASSSWNRWSWMVGRWMRLPRESEAFLGAKIQNLKEVLTLKEKAEGREGKQRSPGKNRRADRRGVGAAKAKEDRCVKGGAGWGRRQLSAGFGHEGPVSSRRRFRVGGVQAAEAESQSGGSWVESKPLG